MTDPRRPITAADLWKLARVGTPRPAPTGGFAVVGVATYDVETNEKKERLWRIDDAGARALTLAEVSSSSPAVSPDGRTLAFLRKPVGKDHPQLHVMPLDGGEARCLSDFPLGAGDPKWFPDGQRLGCLVTLFREAPPIERTRALDAERKKKKVRPLVTEDRVYRFWDHWLTDGEIHHVFEVDVAGVTARDLTPTLDQWFDLMDPDGQYDISPDGLELAFAANATTAPHATIRSAIYTTPIAGGSISCLTADNPADDVRPRYSPDGRWLVYGAKRDLANYTDRVRLARVDRKSGTHEILTEGWDSSASDWEFAGGAHLVLEAEEQGRSCLYQLDVGNGDLSRLLARRGSLHGACPARDGFVWAQHSSLATPPEVARIALASGDVEIVSHFNDAAMADFALAQVEERDFPGAGGDRVHMFVLTPPGASGPLPLVQVLHGGPYGAHHDGWHWRWNPQLFAAPGYVCAFVNFHGSAGFGQAFSDAVHGDWGGRAAQDILLATDLLVEDGVADPKRLAITGGSYGGYMAAWLPTQTDRFACAIAHAAVANLPAIMAGDFTFGVDTELGAAPWERPATNAALDRFDPAAHGASYRTPMLVLHGEKDYRVPYEQGLELYGILQARGVPSRLVIYPDENHWVLKPQNSLHWYAEVHGWLARWLAVKP